MNPLSTKDVSPLRLFCHREDSVITRGAILSAPLDFALFSDQSSPKIHSSRAEVAPDHHFSFLSSQQADHGGVIVGSKSLDPLLLSS